MEVHSVAELERVLRLDLSNAMLGINNRNLETFKVRLLSDLRQRHTGDCDMAPRSFIHSELRSVRECCCLKTDDMRQDLQ